MKTGQQNHRSRNSTVYKAHSYCKTNTGAEPDARRRGQTFDLMPGYQDGSGSEKTHSAYDLGRHTGNVRKPRIEDFDILSGHHNQSCAKTDYRICSGTASPPFCSAVDPDYSAQHCGCQQPDNNIFQTPCTNIDQKHLSCPLFCSFLV